MVEGLRKKICITKSYYLVYAGVSNIKVYFYINKAININKWTPIYYLTDIYN